MLIYSFKQKKILFDPKNGGKKSSLLSLQSKKENGEHLNLLATTVGAQSIAHLVQNYIISLNSISGHRCPRELCFFFGLKIFDRRRV